MKLNFPIFPQEASSMAGHIDALYIVLVVMSIVLSVLIMSVVIFFTVRYHRRSPDERPKPIHGSIPLEIVWSGIPLLIGLALFAWNAYLYKRLFTMPEDAYEILTVGKQWMWKFQHPEGRREINELHVPLGETVRLTMTSEDVIHSLYIPAFRVKMDTVPGRYTSLWFKPTKPGRYHLFCAEYCGTQHSTMGGWVYVLTPSEYQEWLAGTLANAVQLEGEELLKHFNCRSCHRANSDTLAPQLEHIYEKPVKLAGGELVVADADYIRESILYPHKKTVAGYGSTMPSYKGLVNEENILQIIAYLKSLAAEEAEAAGQSAEKAEADAAQSQANPTPETP